VAGRQYPWGCAAVKRGRSGAARTTLSLAGASIFAGPAAAITPTIHEFSVGLNMGSSPSFIAPGADGNLSFTTRTRACDLIAVAVD